MALMIMFGNYRFKQNVQNSRVYTTKALATAINKCTDKPKVFVLVTGVGAYEPSEMHQYDEASPTTGHDFFSRLTIEWEKAAKVDEPVRLVSAGPISWKVETNYNDGSFNADQSQTEKALIMAYLNDLRTHCNVSGNNPFRSCPWSMGRHDKEHVFSLLFWIWWSHRFRQPILTLDTFRRPH